MKRLVCVLVCLGGLASADPLPNATGRVVGLARVRAKVKFFHPYLAYKDIDWDAALVAAIPKAEAATTDAAYRASIAEMIAVLHDPATHVIDATPPAPSTQPTGDWLSWPATGVLEVDLSAWSMTDYVAFKANAARVATEAAKATVLIVDARAEDARYYIDEFGQALPASGAWPTERVIQHHGFRTQVGTTSGSYYSAFSTRVDHAPSRGATHGPARVVFVVDHAHAVPPIAMALQAAGHASIVADRAVADEQLVSTTTVHAGGGVRVDVRIGELTWGLPVVEVVRDPAQLVARAIAIARGPAPARVKLAPPPALPPMRAVDERDYADTPFPSRELRVLAGIRIWAVMSEFNPYSLLVPDWDQALVDAIPALEATTDRDGYLHAVRVLATRAHDGHVRIRADGSISGDKPKGAIAVELRLVEGALAITRVIDAAQAHGLAVGDVIDTIDGKPVATLLAEARAITGGSTVEARDQRAATSLGWGDDGSTVALGVRGKGSVALVRSTASLSAPLAPGPHWKRLANDIGYVDLTTLMVPEVDKMFADLAGTRAIVFDMRGYPNGTAWPIAPRVNVKHARWGAEFLQPFVTGEEDDPQWLRFLQPLPVLPPGASIYRGKVVVLIDDRAISQAEHTCLFLHEAAGATFVGSPTHGADGDVTMFRVPGGLSMSFTGEAVQFVNGTQLQQRGVQPDVLIRPTLAGLRAGKDEVLDRALAWLATGR